jgi:N-acetyl-beta-hexosaminidase
MCRFILFCYLLLQWAGCNLPSANKTTADMTAFSFSQIEQKEQVLAISEPNKPINIIPLPAHIAIKEGNFLLHNKTTLQIPENAEWKEAVEFLRQKVKNVTGFELNLSNDSQKQVIVFQEDKTIKNVEAYSIEVTKQRIWIKAASAMGHFMQFKVCYNYCLPKLKVKNLRI